MKISQTKKDTRWVDIGASKRDFGTIRIAYAQNPPTNAHVDVTNEARCTRVSTVQKFRMGFIFAKFRGCEVS